MADERAKPVLTPARLAANRRNAQKSTGPRTAAGKRRAALNSRRRGLVSPEIERQFEERVEDPQHLRFQATMSDILHQVAAEAAAGVGSESGPRA